MSVPIAFQGSSVGDLWIDGHLEGTVLAQAADRLASHVFIGWDTAGEAWDP
jgi:hypothetical protein